MDRLQQKIDDIRPWLQLVIAPVASLWLAAAIADSRSTSVLMLGLLIGMMLSVSIYFLARKIQDAFWLAFLAFGILAAGFSALAVMGHHTVVGDWHINRTPLLLFPMVLSLVIRAFVVIPGPITFQARNRPGYVDQHLKFVRYTIEMNNYEKDIARQRNH